MYKGKILLFECDSCNITFHCLNGFPEGMKYYFKGEIKHICEKCQLNEQNVIGKILKSAGEK